MNGMQNISQNIFTSYFNAAKNNSNKNKSENFLIEDKVEISAEAYELQSKSKLTARSGDNELKITQNKNNFVIHFDNSSVLRQTVKNGFIELNGQKFMLSDDLKKNLLATDNKIKKEQEAKFWKYQFELEAANSRRANDAMQKSNAKQNRVMKTAARIMHGRKVSPADEKELMEFDPKLYSLAKSAGAIEKIRRKKSDDDEDRKISQKNAEEREKENQPSEDYSVEPLEYEEHETQLKFSVDGENLQVQSVNDALV